jgi:ABC-type glycerol-3-phosphate transport system substrate-binding protein
MEVNMKIREIWRRGLALAIAGSMLVAAGCSDKKENVEKKENGTTLLNPQNTVSNTDQSKDEGKSNAKGRYLESEITLPEDISDLYDLKLLSDGTIGLLDMSGLYLSNDNGKTFTLKDQTFAELFNTGYVMNASLGSDGSIFALNAVSAEGSTDVSWEYYLFAPDGNMQKIAVKSDVVGDKTISCSTMLADGTILVALDKAVYQLAADTGELTLKFKASGNVTQLQEIGDYIYAFSEQSLSCFKTADGQEATDEMLKDLSDYLPKTYVEDASKTHSLVFTDGDNTDTINLATEKGLYRHVKGGSVFEELIKGELSSLSDPSLSLFEMLQLKDGSFLIAYFKTGGISLKQYIYDGNAPAVPQNRLTVYSLEENEVIRQAIVDYGKKSLDTYIEYVVGMSGQDGVTKEDAIRNLNTSVLSNEGPDVIILDGLPVDSYIEKGILEDMSGIFENQLKDQNFFENIKKVYEQDDKMFAVPARFSIPIVAGQKEIVDQIKDLDSFTAALKKLREKNPEGSLMDAYTPEGVLRKLYATNAPAWLEENGAVKKEELVHFLSQAKEIYELEKSGVTEVGVADFQRRLESLEQPFFANYKVGGDILLWVNTFFYQLQKNPMLICNTGSIYTDFSEISSVVDLLGDHTVIGLDGQSKGVFSPYTILGINAQSSIKDLAQDFTAAVLSVEFQKNDNMKGYPINKAAFEENTKDPTNDGIVSSTGGGDPETGEMFTLDIRWPNADQLAKLKKIIENLNTPSITDSNLKKAILELAPAALNGEKDVESVANEIINKMQIYLSE